MPERGQEGLCGHSSSPKDAAATIPTVPFSPAHDTSVSPWSSLPEEEFSKTQSVKNQLPHTLGLTLPAGSDGQWPAPTFRREAWWTRWPAVNTSAPPLESQNLSKDHSQGFVIS